VNNISKIKEALIEYEHDAILVISPINRLYATGFQTSAGVLFVTKSDAWFFTDSRYLEAASSVVKEASVMEVTPEITYYDRINELLADLDIKTIVMENNSISYSEYLEWRRQLKVKLIRGEKLLSDLRSIKSEEDLENMKKAQQIAEKSFMEILPLISTKITEKELANELLFHFLKNGADDKSFDTIVVSGKKSSMPHGVPEDILIGQGFLTIDFGVRLNGWCSDTTRTLCIGEPDEEMRIVYNTVLKAQETGINAAKAGMKARLVDAAARDVIEEASYGEYFSHSFGHALGLEIHENPRASKISKDTLQAGVVLSAEPGIYIPGRFGVRIEDVLYITDDGNENLTSLSKELIII